MPSDFSIPDDVGSVALSDTCRLCGKTFHQPAGMILHGLLPSPDSRFPMHIGCWRRASGLDEERPSRSWPTEVRNKLEPIDFRDAFELKLDAMRQHTVTVDSQTTIRAVAHYSGPPKFYPP